MTDAYQNALARKSFLGFVKGSYRSIVEFLRAMLRLDRRVSLQLPEPIATPDIAGERPPPDVAVAPEPRRARERDPGRQNFGTLYYFGDLLDHLSNYFDYIKLMKKADPDCYRLYSKVGGQVVNNIYEGGENNIDKCEL